MAKPNTKLQQQNRMYNFDRQHPKFKQKYKPTFQNLVLK